MLKGELETAVTVLFVYVRGCFKRVVEKGYVAIFGKSLLEAKRRLFCGAF